MPVPQGQTNVQRVSAQQHIYNCLKEWIIDGTLKPGELINDMEIARYFSVSRTPVREAILFLARQGLVQVVPRGTQVTKTNLALAEQVYEAISCLAAEIARLAVRKRKESDASKLRELNEIFRKRVNQGDEQQIQEADNAFHDYILSMADNSYLTGCWHELIPHAERYERMYFRSGMDLAASVSEHENIITAIDTGREGEAARYSQQNWSGLFDQMIKPKLIKAEAAE